MSASIRGGTKRARPVLALHDAVRRYDLATLKRLIEAGSPLSEIDDESCTPLHLAVFGPADAVHEMITIMLAADEEERAEALCCHDDDGLTPLHLAARFSSSKVVDTMLHSIDEEIRTDLMAYKTQRRGGLFNGNWGKKAANGGLEELEIEHMTLLHLALQRLDPSSGDDDMDDEDEDEPLTDAARAEAVAMVRLLIARGADVNARDAETRAPIHQAVGAGAQDVVEMLLNAGADPSVGCKAIGLANTTLHQAVLRDDDGMVRLLIRAAPHLGVDAPGQNGLTALCLAARSNKAACAKALLEGGADPKAVAAYGKCALDIARINHRSAILKLFGEDA